VRPRAWRSRLAASLTAVLLLAGCTTQQDDALDTAPPVDGSAPSADSPTTQTDRRAEDDGPDGDGEVAASEGERPATASEPSPPPEPPASRAEVTATARRLLAGALDEADGGTLALLVVDEHGREVVSHGADEAVLPASTLKVVTAAAALVTFGSDARFTTRIDATAPIDADGVLRGDLVVVAGGDPALATDEYGRYVYPARPRTPIAALVDDLVAAGLTVVEGDVLGVIRGYEGPRVATGWPDRYFSSLDARYHDGLTVDAGLRTILRYPEPEDEDEDDPDDAEPRDDADSGSEDTTAQDTDDADTDADDPDADDPDGTDDADAEDTDGEDGDEVDPETLGPPTVTVDHAVDPAAHALAELTRLLEERGVEVRGETRIGEPQRPVVGRLASVSSPPLEELLRFAVQRSDNQLTDGIFRAVGRARVGDGSFEGGARATGQVLARLGVDTDGLVLADGSGLSRDDRLTARLLVDLERAMLGSRHAPTWRGLMAVMGESGTLDTRLRGTIAQGRFAGKTGTLRDVTALVGTMRAADGRRYHLAAIVNDPGSMRWIGRTLTDELIVLLVADLEGCAVSEAGDSPGALGVPPLAVRCG
jgi:serine-type D-Ala-D-Ala carboxypeptidase/endopeptidase (penicillin-binding protein 4)